MFLNILATECEIGNFKDEEIDEILKGNLRLGKVYCLNQELEGPRRDNVATQITVDGVVKTIVAYQQKRDRVKIEEVISYV